MFQPGDDPSWADPVFDDTRWKTILASETWSSQGYPGYTGFAWYRKRIEISNIDSASSILMPPVDDTYEVFWNGSSIGRYGGFPPHARLLDQARPVVYTLPASGPATGVLRGVLAIRVWKAQLSSLDPLTLGGLNDAPLLGDQAVLEMMAAAAKSQHDRLYFARDMLSGIVLVAGLICLILYLQGQRKPIYLWLAIYLISDSVAALQITLFTYSVTQFDEQLINAARAAACHLALFFILLHLFGMAADLGWRRWTIALVWIDIAVEALDTAAIYFWQFDSAFLRWMDGITTGIYTAIPAYLFFILAAGLRRRSRLTFWPLTAALSAYTLYGVVIDLTSQGNRFTGWHWSATIDGWALPLAGHPVGARTLLDMLFLAALLFTVAQQQRADRERQAVLELEIKSAQEIQRILVPEELPECPGFSVSAVYQPAAEVGGDFFQILPLAGASVLVVIGDVSGKGLKAAMTVSLIVGAIRTLADTTESPAAILSGLNRRLTGRTAGGFATCLALCVADTGEVTLANAGHLAPFKDREELLVEGSMPLGLVEGLTYDEYRFTLGLGERLTLYTDGLLEARNSVGELFGFARVSQLMARLPTVSQMMEEAAAFGQDDDITLLSLTRTV